MSPTTWRREPPTEPGTYLVRPLADAFLGDEIAINGRLQSRVVEVVDTAGRFDAGDMAGDVGAPCWEWNGPIQTPSEA